MSRYSSSGYLFTSSVASTSQTRLSTFNVTSSSEPAWNKTKHCEAMAAALFEPSLSQSGLHAPFQTAEAPSIADTLPNVNFGFEDLRERMNAFTVRFDRFIEKGRKRVLEERNQFRMNVAELKGMVSRSSDLLRCGSGLTTSQRIIQ